MDTELRISKLNEAEELLRTAAELITEATAGTDLVPVARMVCESVIDAIRSEDVSIMTLKKDLDHDACGDPIWTRPLVSVKNVNRRDI